MVCAIVRKASAAALWCAFCCVLSWAVAGPAARAQSSEKPPLCRFCVPAPGGAWQCGWASQKRLTDGPNRSRGFIDSLWGSCIGCLPLGGSREDPGHRGNSVDSGGELVLIRADMAAVESELGEFNDEMALGVGCHTLAELESKFRMACETAKVRTCPLGPRDPSCPILFLARTLALSLKREGGFCMSSSQRAHARRRAWRNVSGSMATTSVRRSDPRRARRRRASTLSPAPSTKHGRRLRETPDPKA